MAITRTPKPWGYELLLTKSDRIATKLLFVKEGQRLSLQFHKKKHEVMFLHSGQVSYELDKKRGILNAGEHLEIKPMQRHRITAVRTSLIFEVSTPELDDVVRMDDDYGRVFIG